MEKVLYLCSILVVVAAADAALLLVLSAGLLLGRTMDNDAGFCTRYHMYDIGGINSSGKHWFYSLYSVKAQSQVTTTY